MNAVKSSALNPERVVPLLILLSYLFLASCGDLRLAVPEMLGVSALMVLLLAPLALERPPWGMRWGGKTVLLVAALCRVPFLLRPPELSDDIYRYLWDGLRQLSGASPYASAPASVVTTDPVFTALLPLVNHPEMVTIYPPGAQALFAAGGVAGGGVLGLKLFLVLLDLGVILLILRLLKRLRMPTGHAALYGWHPLPVLEIAGSGHIDGAALLFLFLALLLTVGAVEKRRRAVFVGGAALGWSVLVKLFPVVFIPALIRPLSTRGRSVFLLGAVLGGFVLSLPYLTTLPNAFVTLGTYARHWEFGGFAFRTLRELTNSGDASRLLLLSLFVGSVFLLSPLKGTECEGRSVMRTCYRVSLCYLLLTPTLHPWYALYLVAFLPFAAGSAGLVLSWGVLLGYRVLTPYAVSGVWMEDDFTPMLIAVGTLAAFMASALVRRLRPPR